MGDLIKREIDGEYWLIPNITSSYSNNIDYRRVVSYVFPNWFRELSLIDTYHIYKEISFDKNSWLFCYPIKSFEISRKEFKELILNIIMNDTKSSKKIWIPELLYKVSKSTYLPIKLIKDRIIELYWENTSKFTMERASLQVMKYGNMKSTSKYFENSFIKIDGFYRTYLKIED